MTPRKNTKYKRPKADWNKRDFALLLHEIFEIPLRSRHEPTEGRKIFNAILRAIENGLRRDGVVKIAGLGKFYFVTRAAKRRRGLFVMPGYADPNLRVLPPKRLVAFRPAKDIVAILNRENPTKEERKTLKRMGLIE